MLILRLRHLRPRKGEIDVPQVVVYVAPDKTVQIGLVMTIYSRALVRGQGQGNLCAEAQAQQASSFCTPTWILRSGSDRAFDRVRKTSLLHVCPESSAHGCASRPDSG